MTFVLLWQGYSSPSHFTFNNKIQGWLSPHLSRSFKWFELGKIWGMSVHIKLVLQYIPGVLPFGCLLFLTLSSTDFSIEDGSWLLVVLPRFKSSLLPTLPFIFSLLMLISSTLSTTDGNLPETGSTKAALLASHISEGPSCWSSSQFALVLASGI